MNNTQFTNVASGRVIQPGKQHPRAVGWRPMLICILHKQQLMYCCSIRPVSLSLGRWDSQVPSARRQGFQACHSQGKPNPVYQQYTPKSRVLHYVGLLYCMSVSSNSFTSLVNASSLSQCL
jgi:hypothetical protein